MRILADDPRSTAPLSQLLFEPDVLGKRPSLRNRTLHEQREAVGVNRLGEEVDRTSLHRRDGILNATIGRHNDHLQLRVEFPGSTKHLESVADRKREVSQDERRTRRAQVRDRPRLVGCVDHDMPLRLERLAERARRLSALDEKDRKGHGRFAIDD